MTVRFRIRTPRGQELSFASQEMFAEFVRSGDLSPDDLVYDGDTGEWAPARTHPVVLEIEYEQEDEDEEPAAAGQGKLGASGPLAAADLGLDLAESEPSPEDDEEADTGSPAAGEPADAVAPDAASSDSAGAEAFGLELAPRQRVSRRRKRRRPSWRRWSRSGRWTSPSTRTLRRSKGSRWTTRMCLAMSSRPPGAVQTGARAVPGPQGPTEEVRACTRAAPAA